MLNIIDDRIYWHGHLWQPHIGGFAKRAHPARARYLNVNLARRNRDLQPGGKEIEGGGRGGGEGGRFFNRVLKDQMEQLINTFGSRNGRNSLFF